MQQLFLFFLRIFRGGVQNKTVSLQVIRKVIHYLDDRFHKWLGAFQRTAGRQTNLLQCGVKKCLIIHCLCPFKKMLTSAEILPACSILYYNQKKCNINLAFYTKIYYIFLVARVAPESLNLTGCHT